MGTDVRQLGETEKFIAPITDSPKLPPVRVTLTLGALAKAKHVLFVVTGESKAAVVKDILEVRANFAQRLRRIADFCVECRLDISRRVSTSHIGQCGVVFG